MTIHSLPKSPKVLRENIAHLELMFSIQQYILLEVVRNLTDQELTTLATETELLKPITDDEVTCSLSILADDIDQFGMIEVSLNQLGDGVRLAFELHTNIQYNEDVPQTGVHQYLVSIHLVPEWRKAHFEDDELVDVQGPFSFWDKALTAKEEIAVAQSKWQNETAKNN